MADPLTRRSLLARAAAATLIATPGSALAQSTVATLDAVRANVIGLSIFVLRTRNAVSLSEWYAGVLRLPMVRGHEVIFSHWGGETQLLELLQIETETPPNRLNDPATAPTTLVYRVHDIDGLLARLARAGVPAIARSRTPTGREAFVRDPDGNLIGFRERLRNSPLPGDAEAWRRRDRGDNFNPGASMMPPDIQGFGWVVRRVADVGRAERFYAESYGLRRVGRVGDRVLFDLGENILLELAPGGRAELPVASRKVVPAVPVVRVADHDLLNRWLKANLVTITDDTLQYQTTNLSYALDPEGHMTGFDERLPPARFRKPRRPYPEELEIARRWLAGRSAPQ